ncbi:MAG: AAA family ATPase [Flavobacteriales bacterium]|jgi:AAA15 family ATPase/GTPase
MIISFTVKNYRSFKDEAVFSMEASSSKGKLDNVAEVITKNGKKFKLLKSAVIYGANASGKSNVIRAYWTFRQLISSSFRYDVNDEILLAEPFQLSQETENLPCEFALNFIGWDKQQYIYSVSISRNEGIVEETLKYYPSKTAKLIYRRRGRKITSKNAEFFKGKFNLVDINPKRLLLSELGNSGNLFWEELRNYFLIGTIAINSSASGSITRLTENSKRIFDSNDEDAIAIRNKIIKLVKISDLGIKDLDLQEDIAVVKADNSDLINNDESYSDIRKEKRFKTSHNVYASNELVGKKQFDLIKQGSTGTVAIVGLSAEILVSLAMRDGRLIWIDEIDNSLHPYLCRFLISLFNHPKSNPNNSQLIFATHETTLLDRKNFRKDQIWITSKDKFGVSKLYSVHDLDIEGLRDDVPFDKWYMSGKFGGLPKIKELDFIFDRLD